MDSAGPDQTGGDDQGSGMSDSGSPRAGGDASAPGARRRGGGGTGAEGGARNEERILRRREINRNSQKRIRERRNMEVSNLRTETQRLSSENEALLAQVESLTLGRAEMLRQVQDLTDKWQQSIAENAWLNRENIQLRSAVQQLNTLLSSSSAGTTAMVGAATPASVASTLTAACRADGAPIPVLSPPAVASSSPLPVSMPPASRGDPAQLGKGASCLPVPARALSSLASADGSFNIRHVLVGSDGGVQPPGMLPGLPGLSSLGALLGQPQQVAQAAD